MSIWGVSKSVSILRVRNLDYESMVKFLKSYIHGLSLAFNDATEQSFQEHHFKHSIRTVQFGLILATVLYAVFGVLDHYMLPLTKEKVWIIRYAFVVPILLLTIGLSYSSLFKHKNKRKRKRGQSPLGGTG